MAETRMTTLLEDFARDPDGFELRRLNGALAPLDALRWEGASAAVAAGRRRVDDHAGVAIFRNVSVQLAAIYNEAPLAVIAADPGKNETGKAAAYERLRADRTPARDRLVAASDRLLQRVLDDNPAPPPPPLSASERSEVDVSLTRWGLLSLDEQEAEFQQALAQRLLAVVRVLLPALRSARAGSDARKEAAATPISAVPRLDGLVAEGEGATVTIDEVAHVYAAALVERLRAERDELIALLERNGSWQRVPALRLQDDQGRPTAFRNLAPVAPAGA